MPDTFMVVFVGCLGLAVGSFLNVCIHRLPRDMSIVWPASRCASCRRTLSWYENIPLVSYAVLRGRCRTCRAPISLMYPAVELAAALVAVVWFLHFGPSWLFVSRVTFAFALLALFAIDLQHRILPNVITLPGVLVGLAFSLGAEPGWRDSLIGIAAGGGVLLLISETYFRIRKEEGLGMGDVKMLAMIGAFLGWKLMLVALVLSSIVGSVVGLGIIAAKKGDMKYALPFGSFLTLGALVASLVGEPIVHWYLGFY